MAVARGCLTMVRRWLVVLLALLLVGCDHATKIAAHALLPGHDVSVVRGVLDLHYTENPDTAFSLTANLASPYKVTALVVLAALGMLAVAAYWWRRRKEASTLEHIGYATALAGGVGNILDRAVRGVVVDFIRLPHWPVFNVADVLVGVGVGLLFLGQVLRRRRALSPESSPETHLRR